jgi:hypothetical protein
MNHGIQYWNCDTKDDYEDYDIKRERLEAILKKLKNGKASGEDNIPSELHKYPSEKFKTRLLKLLHEIYASGTTPAEWNSATVLPIYKKEDRKDPHNYRRIK